MAKQLAPYDAEVRDTVVKSTLAGVAATALAVAVFSPAGLGGMIGNSLASGRASDSKTQPGDNPYEHLPAFPAPLTGEEFTRIRAQLDHAAELIDTTRAATQARIEHVRSIAIADGTAPLGPVLGRQAESSALDAPAIAYAAPQASTNATATLGSVPLAPQAENSAPDTPAIAQIEPPAYANDTVAMNQGVSLERDRDLELAELMFAHESF